MSPFETPILLILFNRIESARFVFNEIKKQKPLYLYIAADGPRPHRPDDVEKCQNVRNLINQIDWECELKTLFSDENLGCAKGPMTAITWFFENEEQGIILEDDCIPHPDFFGYCKEMLAYYKDNESVMVISGNNFQTGIQRGDASYYFSAYSNTWGWASWRRAWVNYDFYLNNYTLKEFKTAVGHYFSSWHERQMWIDKFLCMKKQGLNAWDYQFTFHIWKNKGMCINPNTNLVTNIGVDVDATNTQFKDAVNLDAFPILPIKHFKDLKINTDADNYFYKKYLHKSFIQLIWRFIWRTFLLKPKFK